MVCHSGLATSSLASFAVAMVFLCARETIMHLVSFWNSRPELQRRVVGRLSADSIEEAARVWERVFLGSHILYERGWGESWLSSSQKRYGCKCSTNLDKGSCKA